MIKAFLSKIKFTVLFFLLPFTLLLTSCGKQNNDSSLSIPDNEVTVDMNSAVSSLDYSESLVGLYSDNEIVRDFSDGFYVISNLDYSLNDNNSLGVVSYGNLNDSNVLIYSELKSNGNTDNIYLALPDSDDYISIDEQTLLDEESSARLSVSYGFSNVYFCDSSIVGLVNIYYNCFAGDTGVTYYSYDSILCSWAKDGTLLFSDNLSDTSSQQGLTVINSFCVNDKYIIVISEQYGSYDSIIFNPGTNSCSSNPIYEDSVLFEIDDLIDLNNGEYLAFYKDDSGITKASYFDFDNLSYETDFSLPDYISLYGYSDVGVFGTSKIIFSNYLGIFSYDIKTGSFDEIMDYVNSDFSGYFVNNIFFVNDSNFYGVYTSMNGGTEGIYYFSPENSRDENKAITVLGAYKLSAKTRQQLLNYNISDNAYRVVLNDYSLKDTISESGKGYSILENEILNGSGPDFSVIDIAKIDVNKLADNNKLVSWNYLTNLDQDFYSSAYLTNVLDAYSVNGYDYVFVYDFIYRTYLGNSDVIGTTNSFSIKTFKNKVVNDSDTILYSGITQDDYLDNLIKYDAEDYIDTVENSSDFNCDEFITLLEYAKDLPSEATEVSDIDTLYRNGGLVLKEESIIAADGFWEDAYRYFDGNAVLAGFPGSGTSTSIVEYVDLPFLIMAEGNINGAWDVVKSFYDEDYQYSISNAIPVNSYAFDNWGNETLYYSHFSSYGASGDSAYLKKTYYYDGQEYEIPYIEEDNISKIKEAVKSSKKSAFSNDVFYNIILDEAHDYINGNQTAKQAASNMDTRITEVLQGS